MKLKHRFIFPQWIYQLIDIFKEYLPLCWFNSHPLQLTSSEVFFKQNLLFYFAIEFLTQANMIPASEALVEVFLATGLTVLFVFLLLSLNRSRHSFVSIVSAVLFCQNMVAIVCVPIIVWLLTEHSLASYIALGVLLAWDFALISYIMKKTLSINAFASSIVAFIYFVCTYVAAYSFTLAF